ncbi:MAG: glycoside hydrolase family 88 protein [Candidatus Helarchaeota archaeon]|nr:glycoside hydrolase family 88 protein [Candidatus Helarchaeota archaeon]
MGSWGKGLLLSGILAKYLYDQDESALNFVKKWVMQSVETQTPEGELSGGDPSQGDFALIGLSLIYFAKNEVESEKLFQAIRKQADYLLDPSLKRAENGALFYLKQVQQIWVDLMVMICPFLAKVATFLKEPKYIDEAIKQLELHIEYLRDPETGLYRHIWDEKRKKFTEGSLWGRGNGWMLVGLVEVTEQLPDDHPKKKQLITEIQRLLEAIMLCQDEQGFWRIFLDQVSEISKIETAGTLILAYGLSKAIRNEWVDAEFAEYVQKAFDAVITCVREDGMIMNASGLTIDPKFTPYNKPYPHAQGFFLKTANEVKQLLQFLKEKQLL